MESLSPVNPLNPERDTWGAGNAGTHEGWTWADVASALQHRKIHGCSGEQSTIGTMMRNVTGNDSPPGLQPSSTGCIAH
jgi:hypothetical protein